MSDHEAELLRGYVDAFNRHDIDAVMRCFDADPVVIDNDGRRRQVAAG